MESPAILFLQLCLIVTLSISKLVSAQVGSFIDKWCSDGNTYTPNSTYNSNLNAILKSLSNDTRITGGFYNYSAGHQPNEVSLLALCRGDVPYNTCRLCIQQSATSLVGPGNVCPNQKEAFGYVGYCSLRFLSGSFIYGKEQDVDPWYLTNNGVVNSSDGFDKSLSTLMSSLKDRASSGNSSLKYATGNATTSGGETLYGLVQCTPDLSKRSCMHCIQGCLVLLPTCCIQLNNTPPSGVIIPQGSCFVQYDTKPFFDNVPNMSLPVPPPPPPPPHLASSSTTVRKSDKTRIVRAISIALGMSTILFISILLSILSRRKKLIRKTWTVKFTKEEVEALQSLQFSLRTIKHATQNFSDDCKLGEGGFGSVYKGVLNDGQVIAVKRLFRSSRQGDAEFKNEILIMAKLRHRNLARLLGFCLHGKEMILIYEYVANRSLDYFIFDPLKRQSMPWETRYQIINGIARGILYLHEGSRLKIIHRDLKAANVLLDEDFYPKIADFGMARLFADIDKTQTLASKIVGTLGYISPEYAYHRQVSVKSDVYSFGVLVLEIVSGQKITAVLQEDQENLLSFAWKNWTEGTAWKLLDPTIQSDCTKILRCIQIGLLCVQDIPAHRPTMSSVNLMLSSDSVSLPAPLQPAFCADTQSLPDMMLNWSTTTKSSSRSAVEGSVNGVSITELHPR